MFLFHFASILRGKGERQTAILARLFHEQRSFLSGPASLSLSDDERKRIRKLLFNAWNSEMVARLNSNFDRALLTVTNQWKPIQSYYALYFLLTPIRMIKAQGGFGGTDTHERTLTFATNNLWANLPMPWRCRYHVEQHTWQGFPSPPESHAKSGWNLARNWNSYENFAQFLRTTGDHKREERWSKLKYRKSKPGDKRPKKKSISLGYVSFWDALWRIRRWANYLEAQALLEGQEEGPAKEFDSSVNQILMCSMAVLERILSAHLGNDFMLRVYDDYLKTIGVSVASEVTKHLTVRRDLVCTL
jgi:hypothetical protein